MTRHISEEDKLYLYGLLKQNELIGRLWPVYEWDKDKVVYGLTIDSNAAYELLSEVADIQFTKEQLSAVFKRYRILPYGSPFKPLPEQSLLDEFYRKRKERRIRV